MKKKLDETDEELLEKFKLSRIKAYHQFKEFYQPNYDVNPNEKAIEDFRNTLVWNPEVITDENGEAKITFYTSDIVGKFFDPHPTNRENRNLSLGL